MRTSAVLFVGMVIGFLVAGSVAERPTIAQDKRPALPVVRWEYKVLDKPDEATLNKIGADGWELVTSHTLGTYGPVYTFKRAKK